MNVKNKGWISGAVLGMSLLVLTGCTTTQPVAQQQQKQQGAASEEVVATGYQPIQSELIYSAKYDEPSNVLTIVFFEDGVYDFEDVPADVYAAFIQSEDRDVYFTENIKPSFTGKKFSMD